MLMSTTALGKSPLGAFVDAPDPEKIRRMVKDYLQTVDIRIWEAPYTSVVLLDPLHAHAVVAMRPREKLSFPMTLCLKLPMNSPLV